MTDIEMTKLCVLAMGLKIVYTVQADLPLCVEGPLGSGVYDPLKWDVDAMPLVKKLQLDIEPMFDSREGEWMVSHWVEGKRCGNTFHDNLNRAIVECVAKMKNPA